jgi:uncharacterized protein
MMQDNDPQAGVREDTKPMNLLSECRGMTLANNLKWLNEPSEWKADDGGLTIVPRSPSDFFRPYHGEPRDNACLLYKKITGDFTAIAQTTADLAGFGDAAALVVRAGESQWAKLCLERSPIGDLSLVSVVTNPWSDDSNSEILKTPNCYLRVTRKGNIFGMHYSLDGARWRFIRTCAIEMPGEAMVGIAAQAPFAEGCRVVFHSFAISPQPVADFRSGE